MKKITVFIFSFALYANILNGAIPFSPEQHVPILSGLPSPLLNNEEVPHPHFHGHQIMLPDNVSLKVYKAFAALNGNGLITDAIERRINKTLKRAEKLIVHGQETGQLRPFSKKCKEEHSGIREALAIQLLLLNIWGINDDGNLDPRLTTLADFFVENQNAHQITPFAEDGDDELQMVPEQRPPLRRKLFDEER